jgi:glycosyltransferase A (GT-A) superfamily protein (DUF2064 family)
MWTGVFAKQPVAGQVKTRMEPLLGALLGDSGPAALALALMRDAEARLAGQGLGLELVFAPAAGEPWFQASFPGCSLRAQRGPGLGQRMANWFEDVLSAGSPGSGGTAVAVGADSPWTSATRVRAAHTKLLAGADVVLGPDHGGGYYLVGLRRPIPGLFTEIEMSTEGMFQATVQWIRERGLRLELLEPDYDLDVPSDWNLLERDLDQGRAVERASDWPSHLEAFAKRVRAAQHSARESRNGGDPKEIE